MADRRPQNFRRPDHNPYNTRTRSGNIPFRDPPHDNRAPPPPPDWGPGNYPLPNRYRVQPHQWANQSNPPLLRNSYHYDHVPYMEPPSCMLEEVLNHGLNDNFPADRTVKQNQGIQRCLTCIGPDVSVLNVTVNGLPDHDQSPNDYLPRNPVHANEQSTMRFDQHMLRFVGSPEILTPELQQHLVDVAKVYIHQHSETAVAARQCRTQITSALVPISNQLAAMAARLGVPGLQQPPSMAEALLSETAMTPASKKVTFANDVPLVATTTQLLTNPDGSPLIVTGVVPPNTADTSSPNKSSTPSAASMGRAQFVRAHVEMQLETYDMKGKAAGAKILLLAKHFDIGLPKTTPGKGFDKPWRANAYELLVSAAIAWQVANPTACLPSTDQFKALKKA